MAFNVQTGNRIVMQLAALVLILCSFFVSWGACTLSPDEMGREVEHQLRVKGGIYAMEQTAIMTTRRGFQGMPLPVDAASSAVYLGPMRLPYWAGCVCSAFALVVVILNMAGFSAVPKLAVLSLLFVGILVAVWALVNILASGSLGAGAVLLLAGSIVGTTSAMRVDHWAQQAQLCASTNP
ncbi:hypothetical protein [Prosthecobacter sp.]|uniref:hypothetical protein n=1 Tax=Prosthecobacter sp. TaxID=1965333 RepID=UPI003784D16D